MTATADPGFVPFPRTRALAQNDSWQRANCDGCARGYEPERGDSSCEMERALSRAAAHDGRVPLPIARKIGLFTLPDGREMPALREKCAEWEER